MTADQDLLIRDAEGRDAERIAAFNMALARETEDRELDAGRVLRGVRRVLAGGAAARYFVAETRGEVVGQLLITEEWSDWRCGRFWWIQSVFVEPAFRRRGIFRALYEHVEVRARAGEDICGLRLYVEGGNREAQATYSRLGMARSGYEVFEVDWS
ncbi:MAG: GNAT family N-acetyltransferase [Phycisphaerae bacterium]|nr:GNAT family N-acetyltransferase [Phycisphaerae bacterium]